MTHTHTRTHNGQVSRLQTGEDVCREIYEQIKGELKNPLEDYVLFWPEHKAWIVLDKPLGHSRIKAGAQLEFRPRKRSLKIRQVVYTF